MKLWQMKRRTSNNSDINRQLYQLKKYLSLSTMIILDHQPLRAPVLARDWRCRQMLSEALT